MRLERQSLKKWTLITVFCGAHSFFWGVMTQASIPAMLLGLATLIFIFSAIESSPCYQGRRNANPLFARAMDKGIRFRIYITAYIFVSYVIMLAIPAIWKSNVLIMLLFSPYMAEILIGEWAMWTTDKLTGVQSFAMATYSPAEHRSPLPPLSVMERFIATYSTTLITGLLHTAILALICSIFYGVMKFRKKIRYSNAS